MLCFSVQWVLLQLRGTLINFILFSTMGLITVKKSKLIKVVPFSTMELITNKRHAYFINFIPFLTMGLLLLKGALINCIFSAQWGLLHFKGALICMLPPSVHKGVYFLRFWLLASEMDWYWCEKLFCTNESNYASFSSAIYWYTLLLKLSSRFLWNVDIAVLFLFHVNLP